MSDVETNPDYLEPYLRASEKYGSGFGTLLWASPKTQAIRFNALMSAVEASGLVVAGSTVLDVGCGRADLFDFLIKRQQFPKCYLGIEAVESLYIAAVKKHSDAGSEHFKVIRGDFVGDPSLLCVGADLLFYSGSLNTMQPAAFYECIRAGFDAAAKAVAFNFLCSPFLAGASHLSWHKAEDVMAFASGLSGRVRFFDHYLRGDATVVICKDSP